MRRHHRNSAGNCFESLRIHLSERVDYVVSQELAVDGSNSHIGLALYPCLRWVRVSDVEALGRYACCRSACHGGGLALVASP